MTNSSIDRANAACAFVTAGSAGSVIIYQNNYAIFKQCINLALIGNIQMLVGGNISYVVKSFLFFFENFYL